MKIQTSSLNLQSAYNYNEFYERKEKLTVEEKQPEPAKQEADNPQKSTLQNLKEEQAKQIRAGWPKNGYHWLIRSNENDKNNSVDKIKTENQKSADLDDETNIGEMKVRIMKMVLEAITGEKIRVYGDDEDDSKKSSDSESAPVPTDGTAPAQPAPAREITTKYELNEIYHEQESLAFEAAGQVTTENGETFAFALSLSQKREFHQETNVSLTTTAKLTDPLVINFDGSGAKLSSDKVAFDLNADGTAEQITTLQGESAFLALDKNGDGQINDGSELFGPSTGSGFGELAGLDSDSNGWIDENDDLFYELKLWKPGHESSTLLERGVGAISLDSVGGQFQIKDRDQQLLGAVKNQGIWLQEKTGRAGMVQELDLSA